jgi:hypothetical protein
MKLVKLADKYTGWFGEECWRAHGRRFIKKLEHRYNRRYGKKLCKEL